MTNPTKPSKERVKAIINNLEVSFETDLAEYLPWTPNRAKYFQEGYLKAIEDFKKVVK